MWILVQVDSGAEIYRGPGIYHNFLFSSHIRFLSLQQVVLTVNISENDCWEGTLKAMHVWLVCFLSHRSHIYSTYPRCWWPDSTTEGASSASSGSPTTWGPRWWRRSGPTSPQTGRCPHKRTVEPLSFAHHLYTRCLTTLLSETESDLECIRNSCDRSLKSPMIYSNELLTG